MSDLSPEARALLDAASQGDDPTSADRDRIARALAVPLGIAALAPATAQATSVAAASTLTVTALKAAAVAATVIAVGLGARWRREPVAPARTVTAHVASHAPPVVDAPRPTVAPAPPMPAAPAIVVEAPPPVAVEAPARSHAAHPVTVDSLQAESALLGEAHRALNGGDPAGALALLTAYRERFPHGVLREERDVERVLVLCRLGRNVEARDAARAFLRAHPHSPLAPRVESSCAGATPSDTAETTPVR